MKRLRLWLKELSLYQQLLAIIFLVATAFTFFFFSFLMTSLNNFIEDEMYKTIHRSQENVAFYFENGFTAAQISEHTDPNTAHLLYDQKSEVYHFVGNTQLNSEDILATLREVVVSDEATDAVYLQGNQKIIYSTKDLGNGMILVSMVNVEYLSQYRSTLVDNVINLNLMIVLFLFLLLMLWIGTIIHPLNQIRNYINRIRIGESATLKIDRRDEIGSVADALVEMQAEVESQKKIREEMVQNISHDLKTPIATIKSYSESIKDGIYPYETLEKSVDVIIEHASRLEKKVYSLITLNKMNYLLNETIEEIPLKGIIEKVFLSLKVIRSQIEIETKLEDVVFYGQEDPWRIVVENILDNALRYAKSKVTIELVKDKLSISNDGPLIEREHLKKMFRAYEKGTDGQFGLGLSIVDRVCKNYGYLVEADNLNDGVIFTITRQKIQKDKKLIKNNKEKD